jgi:hypothetical protein
MHSIAAREHTLSSEMALERARRSLILRPGKVGNFASALAEYLHIFCIIFCGITAILLP